jgi:hypothetical protein
MAKCFYSVIDRRVWMTSWDDASRRYGVPESKTFILDFLKFEVYKIYQTPINSTVTGILNPMHQKGLVIKLEGVLTQKFS